MLAIERLRVEWKNIKHKTVRQTQTWQRYTMSLRKWYRTERDSNPSPRDIDDEMP